jgi:hypothetical protein
MLGSAAWKRKIVCAIGGAFCLGLLGVLLVALAARVPAFYAQIDALPADQREVESRQFVRRSTALFNEIENEPRWSSTFQAVQVNAWLATDFAEKHAGVLPRGVTAPRVAFHRGRVTLGFRVERGPLHAVISLQGRVWLPEPNLIAVEFERVRAGVLPLPSNQVMGTLSAAAQSAKLDVEWKKHGTNPVALIRLTPPDHPSNIEIEHVDLDQGSIRLAGQSHGHHVAGALDAVPSASADASRNVQIPDASLTR